MQALIERSVNSFTDNRVDEHLQYHVGAIFLTGKGQKTLAASPPIAAVGSFLFNLSPGSTLTKSLLISKKEGSSYSRVYVNKEGYNDTWEAVCVGSRAHKTAFNDNVKRALGVISTKAMISATEFATLAALVGVTDVSKCAYNAMDDILQGDDADLSDEDEVKMGSGKKRKRM